MHKLHSIIILTIAICVTTQAVFTYNDRSIHSDHSTTQTTKNQWKLYTSNIKAITQQAKRSRRNSSIIPVTINKTSLIVPKTKPRRNSSINLKTISRICETDKPRRKSDLQTYKNKQYDTTTALNPDVYELRNATKLLQLCKVTSSTLNSIRDEYTSYLKKQSNIAPISQSRANYLKKKVFGTKHPYLVLFKASQVSNENKIIESLYEADKIKYEANKKVETRKPHPKWKLIIEQLSKRKVINKFRNDDSQ